MSDKTETEQLRQATEALRLARVAFSQMPEWDDYDCCPCCTRRKSHELDCARQLASPAIDAALAAAADTVAKP